MQQPDFPNSSLGALCAGRMARFRPGLVSSLAGAIEFD